jgi:hypothetical protein
MGVGMGMGMGMGVGHMGRKLHDAQKPCQLSLGIASIRNLASRLSRYGFGNSALSSSSLMTRRCVWIVAVSQARRPPSHSDRQAQSNSAISADAICAESCLIPVTLARVHWLYLRPCAAT